MGQFGNQPDFATRAIEITPNDVMDDTTNLKKAALYISQVPAPGTESLLTVMMPDRNGELAQVTFRGVTAGQFLPICVDYVLATGTNVTRIIAYW